MAGFHTKKTGLCLFFCNNGMLLYNLTVANRLALAVPHYNNVLATPPPINRAIDTQFRLVRRLIGQIIAPQNFPVLGQSDQTVARY